MIIAIISTSVHDNNNPQSFILSTSSLYTFVQKIGTSLILKVDCLSDYCSNLSNVSPVPAIHLKCYCTILQLARMTCWGCWRSCCKANLCPLSPWQPDHFVLFTIHLSIHSTGSKWKYQYFTAKNHTVNTRKLNTDQKPLFRHLIHRADQRPLQWAGHKKSKHRGEWAAVTDFTTDFLSNVPTALIEYLLDFAIVCQRLICFAIALKMYLNNFAKYFRLTKL